MTENTHSEYGDMGNLEYSTLRRNESHEYSSYQSRLLRLKFLENVHGPVYTGQPIQSKSGSPLRVALIDAQNGDVVKSGPVTSAMVELFVLKDFNFSEDEFWSDEDFKSKIVGGSLLRRHSYPSQNRGRGRSMHPYPGLYLEEGVGLISDVSYKHTKDHFPISQHRLGARIVNQSNGAIRIMEAITEPFTVKDKRLIRKKPKDQVTLQDQVWQLEEIGRKGSIFDRLHQQGIKTVNDLLTQYNCDKEKLLKILPGKKGQKTIYHALTCQVDNKESIYFSSTNLKEKDSVVFNVGGSSIGLCQEAQCLPVGQISAPDEEHGHQLMMSALDHWNVLLNNSCREIMVDGSISDETNPDTSVLMNENHLQPWKAGFPPAGVVMNENDLQSLWSADVPPTSVVMNENHLQPLWITDVPPTGGGMNENHLQPLWSTPTSGVMNETYLQPFWSGNFPPINVVMNENHLQSLWRAGFPPTGIVMNENHLEPLWRADVPHTSVMMNENHV